MEVLCVLLVLGMVIALPVWLLFAWQAKERRAQPFRALASRFHGQFLAGGPFGKARVVLRTPYGLMTVTQVDRSNYEWVELRLPCGARGFSLEVYSLASVPELRGVRNLSLGDPVFRERHGVRADRPDAAEQFLTPLVQLRIHQLGCHWQDSHVHVIVRRGELLVRKALPGGTGLDLEPVLQLVLELRGSMELAHAEGIHFVEEGAHVLEDALCQVCGDSLGLHFVVCTRCKTPHHGDCWQYNGRCATYGCLSDQCHGPFPAGSGGAEFLGWNAPTAAGEVLRIDAEEPPRAPPRPGESPVDLYQEVDPEVFHLRYTLLTSEQWRVLTHLESLRPGDRPTYEALAAELQLSPAVIRGAVEAARQLAPRVRVNVAGRWKAPAGGNREGR